MRQALTINQSGMKVQRAAYEMGSRRGRRGGWKESVRLTAWEITIVWYRVTERSAKVQRQICIPLKDMKIILPQQPNRNCQSRENKTIARTSTPFAYPLAHSLTFLPIQSTSCPVILTVSRCLFGLLHITIGPMRWLILPTPTYYLIKCISFLLVNSLGHFRTNGHWSVNTLA